MLILSDKLYVPEELVTEDMLEPFTHSFDVQEQSDVVDQYGRQNFQFGDGIAEVRTYTKVKDKEGKGYYGFSRGNLAKLGEMFGQYDWEDRTAAPPMTYSLKFLPTARLRTYEKDGQGQQEAVDQWLKKRHGIIKAPPRFGKTISSIYLIAKLGLKTLITAHQKDLLDQFYNSFLAFSNITDLIGGSASEPQFARRKKRDASGRIVGYFQDYDNPEELDVCFLCWQTFGSKFGPERIKAHRDSWGLVIVDEVHRSGSLKYASIVNKINARHRLGLTGTVERTDEHEKVIHDIIGPVTAEGKVEQIPCGVTVIKTGAEIKFDITEPLPYLHKRIYKNEKRMELVTKYLQQDIADGMFICVAFHRYSVKQLEDYTDTLKCMGIQAEAFYGTMRKDRESVLDSFRSGEVQVAVCNNSMLTGIDIPRWNCYYSCFPNASVVFNENKDLSGNFYQEFSRIRTPFRYEDGRKKKFGIIRDFVDDNGFCFGSFKKRLKAYRHQGFPVEFFEAPKEKDRHVF